MKLGRLTSHRLLALVPFLVAGLVLGIGGASASTPASSALTVPTGAGQTASASWSGTIPAGSNPTSDCSLGVNEDHHAVQVTVPAGAYDTLDATFTFAITWTPPGAEDAADEILSVFAPDGSEVGSSDTSNTTETVVAQNLASGTYDVVACGFANAAPQPYSGSVEVATTAKAASTSLASAPANGLEFSAAVPADQQRDEAEPLMETDLAGNIYTCGPTGFSNAADYAQVSTDGGDQFHLLGTPPRGQQGGGGGGDCGLATAPNLNPLDNFQYAYTGLGPLTGFATSTSPNDGHSIATGGPAGNGVTDQGAGADRQWMVFTDNHDVLLSYNQQEPRNVVVQRSTDGGLTYGPNAAIAAPDPDFPGPMRYDAGHGIVFFGWSRGGNVNLSISKDAGTTWTDCLAAVAPAAPAGFVTVDSDVAGNVYLAYGEKATYHTYLVSLPQADVAKCDQPVSSGGPQPTANPGFSQPVQVDRDAVRTTVFPWLVAGGAPGRVAVAFYGTTQDGNPNTGSFKAAWDVYVNQSVNALSSTATFSQVKATTHPFHYDSICLNGLACDTAVPAGDRSLADFFAIDVNPVTKKLSVVFDRGNKKPDEAGGHVATSMVTTQTAGPAQDGSALASTRPVVRTASSDPAGDALSSYSLLAPGIVPPAPATKNEAAGDFVSDTVGPEVDLHTGQAVASGGFTVTMKVADLSTAALTQEAADTASQSLLWVFHFTNGYQDAAASARWNPAQGFTYGFNDYTTGSVQCGSSGEKCILYPGGTPIEGQVDQASGTIELSVPRYLLRGLGPDDQYGRPTEVPATDGTRLYDATAFSLGNNLSPVQDVQSFLYPLDNTPAMDFLLGSGGSTSGGGGTDVGCHVSGGGAIAGSSGGDAKLSLDVHASLKGDVSYRDPGASVDFRSTAIASASCAGSTATIKGTGTNGKKDTVAFTATATDGSPDSFGITLSSGYARSGPLTRGHVTVH